MTATLDKATDTAETYPHAVLSRGYSNSELTLIKAIWTDTKQVAQQKMQLCIHLYELKQELDANDPSAGKGNNGQSRFWQAFEQGDLPEYVTSNRRRTEEWLSAAEFATSKEFRAAARNSLLALTPSTVCKISRIQHPVAKEILKQHLDQHDFIGKDAAGWLAKQDHNPDVLKQVKAWCKDNPTKALVPSVIKGIEFKVEQAQRQAATPAHLRPTASASSPEVLDYVPPTITAEERHQRNQELLREQNIRDTKEELARPDREAAADLQKYHKLYADALAVTLKSLGELRRALNTIATVKGTIYLDELRECQGPLGFNYLANDITELKRARDLLLEIVQVATSSEGPQSIDWATINTEAK